MTGPARHRRWNDYTSGASSLYVTPPNDFITSTAICDQDFRVDASPLSDRTS